MSDTDEPTVHETVERHVEHVERAADQGLINRRQAERADLDRAAKALADGDVVEMIRVYKELKDYKT